MKISIITATFNSYPWIRDCVGSLMSQTTAGDIEHIVIDGGSEDETLAFVEGTGFTATIVSEPDRGIYDALNKGIARATGEIVGILNSDDFYASPTVIEDVIDTLETRNCDCLFGDLDIVAADHPERVIRRWRGSPFVPGSFPRGWHPAHPTFFVRRHLYERYGVFDTALNVSADFELMLRLLEKHGVSSCYLDKVLVKMRHGGESTGSLAKIIEGNRNIMKAFRKNDIPVSRLYPIRRLLPKLAEFRHR